MQRYRAYSEHTFKRVRKNNQTGKLFLSKAPMEIVVAEGDAAIKEFDDGRAEFSCQFEAEEKISKVVFYEGPVADEAVVGVVPVGKGGKIKAVFIKPAPDEDDLDPEVAEFLKEQAEGKV